MLRLSVFGCWLVRKAVEQNKTLRVTTTELGGSFNSESLHQSDKHVWRWGTLNPNRLRQQHAVLLCFLGFNVTCCRKAPRAWLHKEKEQRYDFTLLRFAEMEKWEKKELGDGQRKRDEEKKKQDTHSDTASPCSRIWFIHFVCGQEEGKALRLVLRLSSCDLKQQWLWI